MTDNEIIEAETLTSGEINKNKIKAIYPHITVSGSIDKPYYNIDWYDIKKQTMYRGFSSYKLPLVYKWLQEEFEVVEADIDDLINRQKAEIERLKRNIELLAICKKDLPEQTAKAIKAEAVKEFAERLKEKQQTFIGDEYTYKFIYLIEIDNLVKEMVGEG